MLLAQMIDMLGWRQNGDLSLSKIKRTLGSSSVQGTFPWMALELSGKDGIVIDNVHYHYYSCLYYCLKFVG